MESKTCCHIPEQHYPQRARRSACGAVLLKTQKTKKKIQAQAGEGLPIQTIEEEYA